MGDSDDVDYAIPQYDPDPIDPLADPPPDDSGDGGEEAAADPDEGEDLGYLVPELAITWDGPRPISPIAPGGGEGAGSGGDTTGDADPFSVDLGSLRALESTMLTHLGNVVAQYESLRAAVTGAVGNPTFFGPAVNTTETNYNTGYIGTTAPVDTTQGVNEVAYTGIDFAAGMEPQMQRALWGIGNAVELAGKYVGKINTAAQGYAQADSSAQFPPPPAPPSPGPMK